MKPILCAYTLPLCAQSLKIDFQVVDLPFNRHPTTGCRLQRLDLGAFWLILSPWILGC